MRGYQRFLPRHANEQLRTRLLKLLNLLKSTAAKGFGLVRRC
jgi:hypothetical protein